MTQKSTLIHLSPADAATTMAAGRSEKESQTEENPTALFAIVWALAPGVDGPSLYTEQACISRHLRLISEGT